jgi:crotonobetainyl-CoA:carnitine CoA-transferase CaiB-like acyl-CoA transferase
MILQGIRVIEWSAGQVGPVACAMLGDLGAEVIKVEEPGKGDPVRLATNWHGMSLQLPSGHIPAFEHHNRNKLSITLDLRQEKGRQVMYRLVEKADVFLTNYRPVAVAALGLDHQTLKGLNPRLVYITSTVFGHNGPDRNMRGLDLTAMARSGMMMSAGEPGMPPVMAPVGIADQMTAITLAYGALAALLARERLGVAQEVKGSMLGAMVALQGGFTITNYLMGGKEIPRYGRRHSTNPTYNWYQCQDGKWLVLGHYAGRKYWFTLCEALGEPELAHDPRFADFTSRTQNAQELITILDSVFAQRPRHEWEERLRRYPDIFWSLINDVPDLVTDPQVVENDYVIDYDHPTLGPTKFVGFPLKFTETPAQLYRPAPEMGQHTDEVLSQVCGISPEEIGALRQEGVV